MDGVIHTLDELEAQVGAKPGAVDLKVIDHLDAQARRWLAASPLACVGFSDAQGVDATLAGGTPGVATASGAHTLHLPRAALDAPELAVPGRGAGLLFLVPGLGETLRVNGMVSAVDGERIVVDVQECYAHCAKALLRSDFWQPGAMAVPRDPDGFLAASRFMALATSDAGLRTDLSPKGDPAGLLVRATDDGLCFADRPGNRRTDSFRNILSRPFAAAVLIAPGSTQVAVARGRAQLGTDPARRAAFAVQEKLPKLVICLAPGDVALRESAALARARPWDSPAAPPDINPAEVFAAHVKLNKARGLRAALARGVVSIPGLMRKGLEQDYKRNMY